MSLLEVNLVSRADLEICCSGFAMLRLAESARSLSSLSGAKLQFRRLVLQACTFRHILDLEEESSTAGVFGHPLWKLSPSRRGVVLQEVARSVLQRAYPESHFQDVSFRFYSPVAPSRVGLDDGWPKG